MVAAWHLGVAMVGRNLREAFRLEAGIWLLAAERTGNPQSPSLTVKAKEADARQVVFYPAEAAVQLVGIWVFGQLVAVWGKQGQGQRPKRPPDIWVSYPTLLPWPSIEEHSCWESWKECLLTLLVLFVLPSTHAVCSAIPCLDITIETFS